MAKIPLCLEDFLDSVTSDLTFEKLLKKNFWARKFHDYLEKKNLTKEILALKFVISVSQLENLHAQKLQEDCTKLLQEIKKSYFNVESNVVPMTHKKDQDECMEMDVQVFVERKLDLLKKATRDPTVWDEGLKKKYVQFVSSTKKPIMACLLI